MGKSIRSKRERKLRSIKREKNSIKEQAKLVTVLKNLPIYREGDEMQESLTAEQIVSSKPLPTVENNAEEGSMDVDQSQKSNESKFTKYTKTQLKRRKERMTLKRKGIKNKKSFVF